MHSNSLNAATAVSYRPDIDGLRTLAVLSVILFHFGFLPNGYLGVDVFFVISGFLITAIVYNDASRSQFSILRFYERRIRRILPLSLFICIVAIVAAVMLMLPEDIESVSQAVVATNFSANNILMYITSGNYWSIRNEYKPLMHTWSLGIEEQFYLLYPLLFSRLQGKNVKYVPYVLIVFTCISLFAFLRERDVASAFFLLQYRLFELSVGGLGAIVLYFTPLVNGRISKILLYPALVILLGCLTAEFLSRSPLLNVIVAICSVSIIVSADPSFNPARIYRFVFENSSVVWLGKISFSLYMWHQLVLAFGRYSFLDHITAIQAALLMLIILVLSTATFYLIERPFRNRNAIGTKAVLTSVGLVFLAVTAVAFYVHSRGGIIRDYPEFGISSKKVRLRGNVLGVSRNENIKYNDDVKLWDRDFTSADKRKVLVIGNSFGRDVCNILREYDSRGDLEITYFDLMRVQTDSAFRNRIEKADFVFVTVKGFMDRRFLFDLEERYSFKIDFNKLWVFGTKDFGNHNGIHHRRYSAIKDYSMYSSYMKRGVWETNELLRKEWGDRYIDLIKVVSDQPGKVLIFTPAGKFISHDTLHLTVFGAQYYAQLLGEKLDEIVKDRAIQ